MQLPYAGFLHDVAGSVKPAIAEQEYRQWYQYYFHTARGRAGLTQDRRGIARLLWQLWSLERPFDEAEFARSAPSFDNPDFVAVVIHSYRVRYGYAPGDPAFAEIETRLAELHMLPGAPLVYCRAGDKTKDLADRMNRQGIPLSFLEGGVLGWEAAGFGLERPN